MSDDQKHSHSIYDVVRNFFSSKHLETPRETMECLIEDAMCDAEGEDNFSEHELRIFENLLCLKDKKCANAMIPRSDIISFHKDGTVNDLALLMVTKGHSRIPIYGDSLDDIIGIIHVIDLVKHLIQGKQNVEVKHLIDSSVKLISPSMRVIDLLHDMQVNKVHMAMVVNEYGGIDGLITIEDLLEEIVGDIEDEYDFEDDVIITLQEDGVIIADAKAELQEIKNLTKLNLLSELNDDDIEVSTLGGIVFHIAQRIPNLGEIIESKNGIKFKILDVAPQRIKKVMIVPLEANIDDVDTK